jgi:hypothetical protein
MRKIILLIPVVALMASCKHDTNSVNKVSKADTAVHTRLVIGLASDTNRHNFTDDNGKRQGYWIITNETANLPGYEKNAKVEEGTYQDGMREGQWIEYNADGSVKSATTFKNDQPVN